MGFLGYFLLAYYNRWSLSFPMGWGKRYDMWRKLLKSNGFACVFCPILFLCFVFACLCHYRSEVGDVRDERTCALGCMSSFSFVCCNSACSIRLLSIKD